MTGKKNPQNRDDLLAIAPTHLAHEFDARHQIYGAARPKKQAVALYQEARHAYRLGVRYPITTDVTRRQLPGVAWHKEPKLRRAPERIVNHGERELNILRDTVDPNALNDSVDLMSSSGTLTLLAVEHDPMLYLRIFVMVLSTAN
jgi:hypothetical protein